MTVTNPNMRATAVGNGVSTTFAYGFRVLAAADLLVSTIDTTQSPPVVTMKALNTDYTVTGVGLYAGGNVVFTVAPANGLTVMIQRQMLVQQPTDLRNQGQYYAETMEDAYDRAAMIDQQESDAISRAVRLSNTDTSGANTTLPFPVPGAAIGWDSTGKNLLNLIVSGAPIGLPGGAASLDLNGLIPSAQLSLAVPKNWGTRETATLGLTYGYYGGKGWNGTAWVSVPTGTVALTASQTNYVQRTLAGAVSANTAGFTSGQIPMAVVVTGPSSITSVTDYRDELLVAPEVAFTQAGTGAVVSTVDAKLKQIVHVDDFPTVGNGVTDDTAAIQSAINSLPSGGRLVFGPKSYAFTTLTVNANNVQLEFNSATNLIKTTTGTNGIVINGTGCSIIGHNGTLTGPAAWDGTNVAWTYANVYVTAPNCTITDLHLINVQKVGIGFRDIDNGVVRGVRIDGNYPSGQWTGVETVHFGITSDPSANPSGGEVIVEGCTIKTCVQGVFIGNYGAGVGRGHIVSGNVFEGCWNHGVYVGLGVYGTICSNNNFNRCALPISMTGDYSSVVGNVITTYSTGSYLDQSSISMRDSDYCLVANNIIQGDTPPSGTAITFTNTGTGTTITNNIVSGNQIYLPTGSGAVGIQFIGIAGTTAIDDNLVVNNQIRMLTQSTTGAIAFAPIAAITCNRNRVVGNRISMIASGYAIQTNLQRSFEARNNTITLEHTAGSATTEQAIYLTATTNSLVDGNRFICTSTFGTNITWRGIWENTGSSGNLFKENTSDVDMTLLAAWTPVAQISTTVQTQIIRNNFSGTYNGFDQTLSWNDNTKTWKGLFTNVLNTASGASSLLLDLQVNGSSQFSVNLSGQFTTQIKTLAGTTSFAQMNLPPGVGPASPNAGDIWNSTAGFSLKYYANSAVQTLLSTVNTRSTGTPANPTGTTSTTAVMMGTSSGAPTFSQISTTKALITISGQMANNTAGDGVTVQMRFGSGNGPANGAATTGTAIGATQTFTAATAGASTGFSITAIATGLVPNSNNWVDLAVAAVTGGTATVTGLTVTITEC